MKGAIAVTLLAFASTAAVAQEQAAETPWQFFDGEGGMYGALVQSEDGSQVAIKCDKPGRKEVYAMILPATKKLAVANIRAITRPIRFQFDSRSPTTENWRIYETYASALGKTGDASLTRFITGLRNASAVKIRVDTGIGPDVDLAFDVSGARDAVTKVYTTCKDSPPA